MPQLPPYAAQARLFQGEAPPALVAAPSRRHGVTARATAPTEGIAAMIQVLRGGKGDAARTAARMDVIGRLAAKHRGATLDQVAEYARHGAAGPRRRGAVGFSVMRGGEVAGDHRVFFAGPGEQIELAHHAQDRSGFARGALVAARWVAGRPAGLYSMRDVLGL